MYVCKVIGKIISTVKNEKLVGHSIVLVQAAIWPPLMVVVGILDGGQWGLS